MNRNILLLVLGGAVTGGLLYFLWQHERPLPQARAPLATAQSPAAASGGPSPDTPQPPDPRPNVPPVSPPAARAAGDAAAAAQGAPPLEPEIRKALGEVLDTSSAGLVEETRNGVTGVDLQRRFRTAPVATVDAHGNVQITDYSSLPKEPATP
jgi:hypothetical protein